MKSLYAYSIIISLSLIVTSIIGQAPIKQLNFSHFTTENGLPSMDIHQTVQDRDGFLWIATSNGLTKFDGQYFKSYFSSDFGEGLSSNVTSVLVVDSETIWLIVDNAKLLQLNTKKHEFTNVFETIDTTYQKLKESITNLKVINGEIYVIGDVTYVFKKVELQKVIKFYGAINDLLIIDNDSFLTAEFDLCTISLQREKLDSLQFNVANQHCITHKSPSNQLLKDHEGNIWSAPWANAINKVNCIDKKISTISLSSSPNSSATEVNALAEDRKGNIWIATNNNGLHVYDKDVGLKKMFSIGGPSQYSHVTSLYSDDTDRLWIGTKGEGLFLHDPQGNKAINFKIVEDVEILDVFELDNNVYLLGSTQGLWVFDDGKLITQIGAGKYRTMKVFDIYQNHKKEILLGTDIALLKYEKSSKKILSYNVIPNRLPNKELDLNHLTNTRILHLQDYILDRSKISNKDDMGNGYLENRLNNQDRIIHFGKPNPSKSHYHNCSDTVLIGTLYGHGIFTMDYESKRFDSGQFNTTLDNRANIIETNRVNKVYLDSVNGLWGLSEHSGAWLSKGVILNDSNNYYFSSPELIDFCPQLGVNFSLSTMSGDAYNSDNFQDMVQLAATMYLVITLEGEILRIDIEAKKVEKLYEHFRRLHKVIAYENGRVFVRDEQGVLMYKIQDNLMSTLDQSDGIKFSGSSALMSEDGMLILGGRGGISLLHKSDLEYGKKDSIHIYLKNIHVMGESIILPHDNNLHLKFDENFLDLDLSHLMLTQKDFKYEYRVPEIHKNWIKTSTGKVTYNNISPGSYVLEARLQMNDNYSIPAEVLSFTITPPWWLTWWFYLLSGTTIAACIYAIYWYKINEENAKSELKLQTEIKAQEEERKRLSRELHDDFGMKMSSLRMYVDAIENLAEAKDTKLVSLSNDAMNLVDESMKDFRNLLSNLSPNTLKVNGLAAAVDDIIFGINSLNLIKVNFKHNYPSGFLSEDAELNLFRIIQELINNSVKHSGCKHISIALTVQQQVLELIYRDDGVGITKDVSKDGYGLNNIKNRMSYLKGKYKIDADKNGFNFHAEITRHGE